MSGESENDECANCGEPRRDHGMDNGLYCTMFIGLATVKQDRLTLAFEAMRKDGQGLTLGQETMLREHLLKP